ncbi:MAG: hypothetical protein ACOYB2_06895 [Limnohabitans sp.]
MPSDDEIRAILHEPGISNGMKNVLSAAIDRDPVDAVIYAEFLAIVLRHWVEVIQSEALAAVAIRRAKWRLNSLLAG